MRRKISVEKGLAALQKVRELSFKYENLEVLERDTVATAVRFLLEELAVKHPGSALEVRVPPFGAVQCLAGPKHTRGTPPNVIECDPQVWFALALGELNWDDAVAAHKVTASGPRASLREELPLC